MPQADGAPEPGRGPETLPLHHRHVHPARHGLLRLSDARIRRRYGAGREGWAWAAEKRWPLIWGPFLGIDGSHAMPRESHALMDVL